MTNVEFSDFVKLDIRICLIEEALPIEGSDKLFEITIATGDEKRSIVAGVAGVYSPGELQGRKVPVLLNLEPRKIMGIESRGMLIAADFEGDPVLLSPDRDIPPGCTVR